MRTILHILETDCPGLATKIVQAQAGLPGCKVEQFDLSKPDLDYGELLESIFKADSVAVW